MVYITNSANETENVGRELAKMLSSHGINRAFIALRGEMGVGKTAFTRGFADYFGIKGVKSPTYTIVNEYRGKCNIFHFDMYRIESEDDLYSIGFDDYIEADGYAIAEWAENVEDYLPKSIINVTVSRVPENDAARKILIDTDGFDENISN
jgi:tRNA threonylcarbamoyladenosine biosynthesis protein TsaE